LTIILSQILRGILALRENKVPLCQHFLSEPGLQGDSDWRFILERAGNSARTVRHSIEPRPSWHESGGPKGLHVPGQRFCQRARGEWTNAETQRERDPGLPVGWCHFGWPDAKHLPSPIHARAERDCNVEVTSDGFKRAKERVTVNQAVVTRDQYVFVYLHPESEVAVSGVRPVVTPNLLQEMDKSAEAIRKSKLADARKHLDKALRISPNNPDVLYLNGLLDMNQANLPEAERQFQRAVSIYPTHERSLLALGKSK